MQNIFAQIFALIAAAVVLVWVFKRIGLPAILAYLATGLLAGSHGIGWMTNSEEIHLIAELGIVFLLFSLGLEFSLPRLMAMRNIVFGLGTLQVLVTTGIGMMVLKLIGYNTLTAFTIAALMALSSTAVVVKVLKESGTLNIRRGQLAIGVLLFQDIAVVPLLIALPLLANSGGKDVAGAILFAFAKGAFVCIFLLAVGKWLLPKVFNEVASARSDELFVLTTILVALCAGMMTYAFGLSMALGAFLAGMMLGESHYRHQLEAEIRPFRDILMGLFFVTVGMELNLNYLADVWGWVAVSLIGLLVCKVIILAAAAQTMGERKRDSIAAGLMLWQMGEFGFVLVALASKHHMLDAGTASFLIALGVLSMAATPYIIDKLDFILDKLNVSGGHDEGEQPQNNDLNSLSNHVVIVGFGRVGQTIARFLKPEAIPYVAVDFNPTLVQEAKAAGEAVYFGHAGQKAILKSAGIEKARLVIISFVEYEKSLEIIDTIKRVAPEVNILVRTRDDTHVEQLKLVGVTEVVPEELEASLMLVSHVLFMSGVPMKRILRRVSKERQNRYAFLHGFFAGDTEDLRMEQQDRLEFLHAIALPENAFAVNKTIKELGLLQRKVEISALRRNGAEISMPDEETQIRAHDVVLLKGKPRRVERAEQFLLDGLP
ncbi:cation:proton antiporter [Pseudoalteromonas xiamenensis]|uniref:cation:proton antiporter domain-containing protein n=1 Tax=Pseudoalteromonas xiamenensis TaxID=882626 RepID=UPI0027E54531|nr:cation:proton antiporter [Pseudoalteromonas xiamenensis]WMN59540.1 cation:proton antiporter [Pseudoalteromonas xiamenensis]